MSFVNVEYISFFLEVEAVKNPNLSKTDKTSQRQQTDPKITEDGGQEINFNTNKKITEVNKKCSNPL